jgi:two-component system sensor histidine kinase KdpD
VIRPGNVPDPEQERALHALRSLASVLGATLIVEEGDDVATTVARVAQERGITYILLGAPRPARGLARLREPLAMRLIRLAPGVDVRIVADRTRMHARSEPTS